MNQALKSARAKARKHMARKGLREMLAPIAKVWSAIDEQAKIADGGTVVSSVTVYALSKQVRGLMGIASQMPRGNFYGGSTSLDNYLNDANQKLLRVIERANKLRRDGVSDNDKISSGQALQLESAANEVAYAGKEINRFLRNQHLTT